MICSFASNMHIYRILTGYTGLEFGKKLNVSQATVSAWENESRSIPESAIILFTKKILYENPDFYLMQHNFDKLISQITSIGIYPEYFSHNVLLELAYLIKKFPFLKNNKNIDLPLPLKENDNNIDFPFSLKENILNPIQFFSYADKHSKDNIIKLINNDETYKEYFHWFVSFILKDVKFTIFDSKKEQYLPDYIFTSIPELITQLLPLSLFSDKGYCLISISSPRTRADLFRLLFTALKYDEKSGEIPPYFTFVGISGVVYEWKDTLYYEKGLLIL